MFKIIKSSSKGNSFLFGSLLIDVGVSIKTIKELEFDFVLLTHEHSDHFKISTIIDIYVKTKAIFVCGEFLSTKLLKVGIAQNRILIVETGKVYQLGLYRISPIILYHDVPNFGYRIMIDNYRHIHATDTSTLDGISALDYDSASLECNHKRDRAIELIQDAQISGEYSHLLRAINSHLSVESVVEFIQENRIKKLYPCHIGSSTEVEIKEYLDENNF